jgi:hypothetical protein
MAKGRYRFRLLPTERVSEGVDVGRSGHTQRAPNRYRVTRVGDVVLHEVMLLEGEEVSA